MWSKILKLMLVLVFLPSVAWAAELSIPVDRIITWQDNVGVVGGIPTTWANCTTTACNTLWNSTPSDPVTVARINSAISSAPANTVVRIPAGTYSINGSIAMPVKSNMILRGAGMGVTILNNSTASNNITTQQTGMTATARAITSGYTQGSTSIVAANVSGVVAGQGIGFSQLNSSEAWSCGGGDTHLFEQTSVVTGVVGNTISFSPPLVITMTAGLSPVYSVYSPSLWRVGFEDFTLNSTGSADTMAQVWFSNEVWFKGVELTGFTNIGIHFYTGSRGEVRKCKIHDISGQDYYQEGYGVYIYSRAGGYPSEGGSGGYLIENNLFYKVNMAILASRSSGNVIGYNFIRDTHHFDTAHDWMIPGINFNHGSYGAKNLIEGNVTTGVQNDGYHGSGGYSTIFRNYFHGVGAWLARPLDNRKPIDLARGSQYHNVIGNVLGASSWNPSEYTMTGDRDYSWSAIYRLGYPNMDNNGITSADSCPGHDGVDSLVSSTLFRHKNYDDYTNTQRICSSETEGCQGATNVAVGDTIKDSMYLASKPTWFGTLAYPPVNPTTGVVTEIPAQYFDRTGSWPSETPPDGEAPTTPSNLTAVAASSTQINLSWTASTDNVGIAGYNIERCTGVDCTSYVEVATTTGTGTTYNNTGLTGGLAYRYRIRARDAYPNYSGYSSVVGAAARMWPLKINGRYLEDQAGVPFFVIVDAGWELMTQISNADALSYIDDRAAKGFSAIEVRVIGHSIQTNAPRDYYNNEPFTGGHTNWSTRNEAYWSRIDTIVAYAKSKGMIIMMFPSYLGAGCGSEGWCGDMVSQSDATMTNYGTWLGARYASYGNIIWMRGGDTDCADHTNACARDAAMVAGVRAGFAGALFSVEPMTTQLGGIDSYASGTDINGLYSLGISSDMIKRAYQNSTRPFMWQEGEYENEHSSDATDWNGYLLITYLGGGLGGSTFGSCPLWSFGAGTAWCDGSASPFNTWQNNMGSPGSVSSGNIGKVMRSRKWWTLVPDYANTVVTSTKYVDYLYFATARETAGKTVMVWCPIVDTVTVNMASIVDSGSQAKAWWWNPDTNVATLIGTYANSGSRNFTPPASRRVLVIDSNALALAAPGSTVYAYDGGTTPPSAQGCTISSNGTTVNITFSEAVVMTDYDAGEFNLDCSSSGSNISLSSLSGSGTSWNFTSASTIRYGETCNLDYIGDANSIEDVTGDNLAVFSDMAVTNNSTSDITPPTCTITTNGGVNYSTASSSINIQGTSSDNVLVSYVAWACPTCTPVSGSASGVNPWTTNAIGLIVGANTVTVTATDSSNNTGSDSIIVTRTQISNTCTIQGGPLP